MEMKEKFESVFGEGTFEYLPSLLEGDETAFENLSTTFNSKVNRTQSAYVARSVLSVIDPSVPNIDTPEFEAYLKPYKKKDGNIDYEKILSENTLAEKKISKKLIETIAKKLSLGDVKDTEDLITKVNTRINDPVSQEKIMELQRQIELLKEEYEGKISTSYKPLEEYERDIRTIVNNSFQDKISAIFIPIWTSVSPKAKDEKDSDYNDRIQKVQKDVIRSFFEEYSVESNMKDIKQISNNTIATYGSKDANTIVRGFVEKAIRSYNPNGYDTYMRSKSIITGHNEKNKNSNGNVKTPLEIAKQMATNHFGKEKHELPVKQQYEYDDFVKRTLDSMSAAVK